MSVEYTDARAEMFQLVQTRMLAACVPTIVGSLAFRFQGIPNKDPIPADAFTVRTTIKTESGNLSAHVTEDDGVSKKQFSSFGLIFISIFAPLTQNDYIKGGKLAAAAKKLLEGSETSSSVWFRNVRINELPEEDANYSWNVVGEFTYDTING